MANTYDWLLSRICKKYNISILKKSNLHPLERSAAVFLKAAIADTEQK